MAEEELEPIAKINKFRELFEKLRRRFGLGRAVIIALLIVVSSGTGFVWWNWKDIEEKPGIRWVAELLERRPIPKAQGHLTIAVVHFERDTSQQYERLVLDELRRFQGADLIEIDRTIELPTAGIGRDAEARATEEARGLARKAGSDVLLWGSLLSVGDHSALRLYWTPARQVAGAKQTERYQAEAIALPALFWDDLKQVLGLLVQTRLSALMQEMTGRYAADKLKPLIDDVKQLLANRQGSWDAETDARVRFALAGALQDYGDQSGRNDALDESVDAYRQVLKYWTRDKLPLAWATTQNNLGNALKALGERESGTTRLEEAVAAYREAVKEYTRERLPLDWATTQHNLGGALTRLGERESGTARLEEAVTAYRAALLEFTRDRVPLDWATTQNNLGTALRLLGERESGTALLKEAVAAFRDALGEYTRERVPLDWALTQNNLGNALATLGDRESGTARLDEAVAAFRAALKERTRERVPLDWAQTQNNLGNALKALGERESRTTRLGEAVAAYRLALQERTHERVPLDWATTQNNLGAALQALGERESGTARLEEAVAAYRAALEEYTRERVPLQWAYSQQNFALALEVLAKRLNDRARLEDAIACMRGAAEVYRDGQVSYWLPIAEDSITRMQAELAAMMQTRN